MKLNLTKKVAEVTLFAGALLATSLFAGGANAQSLFQGKFTLQNATCWGKIVLPAGDYWITLSLPQSGFTTFVIQNANSGRTVAFEASSIVENASHTPGNSKLLVGTRGNQRVVYTFHVVELDGNFIYDPLLAQRHGVIEAKATENIPVLLAKKQ